MSSIGANISAWSVLGSRPLLDRSPWLRVWEEDVLLPNGHRIDGYLLSPGRDYAMVFVLMVDGMVPVVRQYKHGMGEASLDLPAGYLDEGEEPLTAARRELQEETGITAETWRSLGSLVVDTNRSKTAAHLFLALDGRRDAEQALDESESLEVEYHAPEELRNMVLAGEIRSLATVAGIMTALQII